MGQNSTQKQKSVSAYFELSTAVVKVDIKVINACWFNSKSTYVEIPLN